jgi:nucleotide-binding universal stress UspA family protein
MNCRGLTELVILNIGLDLGVIPPVLFAMLVIMALVTTFMTSPALSLVLPRSAIDEMAARDTGQALEAAAEWEILVHLPNLDRAYELVHTALSLARDQQQRVRVVLLRTLHFDNDLSGGALTSVSTDRSIRSLRPIVEFVKGAGCDAVPVVIQSASVGDTIVGVVNERKPDVVLMSWRQPLFGSGLLRGPVGEVLRKAPADVAVLVDPGGHGTSPRRGEEILVPYGGGSHDDIGLEFALRLARTHGANVHLLGADDTDRAESLATVAAAAYERSHVWTSATSTSGDLADAVVDGARSADLVVLGVGDTWAEDAESLGELQDAVAARTGTPLLLVRRWTKSQRSSRRRRSTDQPSAPARRTG